jgi:ATP-dependent Clp protease adaptor protein ClpS
VVIYNDWANSMPRVVYVLIRTIPGMNVRRATALMYEAHSNGKATVKRCHRELAEMYAELLQKRSLTAKAEPAR